MLYLQYNKKILNNMKKLPEQFSVYARTKEEAVYISQKQKEMCGSTFNTPEYNMFYRFSPNRAYDKWGYNSTSYINHSGLLEYNIQHEFTFEKFKSYFEEVNNKVCFKGDGTNETGDKIINELIRLGGENIGKYDGNSDGRYYYINDKGNVDLEYNIPKGYTLTELPSEVKLNIGDAVKVKPDARYRTAVENDWRSGPFKQTAREIQYIFKIEGDLICIDYKDYWDRDYFVVERKNVELVESKIKEIKMKNRILTPQNATRIINIACSTWKPKLAEKWATNIVLNKDTEISEEFYQEMRKACTTDQNTLFDEIFGKDEQLIKISNLAIGEAMIIHDNNTRYDGVIVSRIWSEDEPRYVNMNDRKTTWAGYPDFKGKKIKLTIIHEEIK
jgi:hypothetical protein